MDWILDRHYRRRFAAEIADIQRHVRRPRPLEPHFLKLLRFFLSPPRRIELDLIINDIRTVAQEMKAARYPHRTIRAAIAWHTLRSSIAILYDGLLTVLARLDPAAFLLRRISSSTPPPPEDSEQD